MPVRTRKPTADRERFLDIAAPHVDCIPASRLAVGDRFLHLGRLVRVLRSTARARIELLVAPIDLLGAGTLIKLRDGTVVERFRAGACP